MQALTLLKSLAQAQENYYLANGSYAQSFDELPVEIPWTGNEKWIQGPDTDTRSNQDWSLQIYTATASNGEKDSAIYLGRLTGRYRGAGFVYFVHSSSYTTSKILCGERRYNGITYEGTKGGYCEKIFKATPTVHGSYLRMYILP
ncbi:MAG: type IV pilin-like G/H family protein [Elusimicrobiaceae bacterium]|nr:type IV pilin-like G/H family protein [Elusimicrobiaceae bacterium]